MELTKFYEIFQVNGTLDDDYTISGKVQNYVNGDIHMEISVSSIEGLLGYIHYDQLSGEEFQLDYETSEKNKDILVQYSNLIINSILELLKTNQD